MAPAALGIALLVANCKLASAQTQPAPSSQQVTHAFMNIVEVPNDRQHAERSQELASDHDALATDACHLRNQWIQGLPTYEERQHRWQS